MIKKIYAIFTITSSIFALPLQVGDVVPDFSVPICINGTGDFNFYERANGEVNDGNYRVTWLPIFASW